MSATGKRGGTSHSMALLRFRLKKLDPELKAVFEARPPVRAKIFLIKRRHLKRLEELSLKAAEKTAQLEEPTEDQDQWIKRRMHGSAKSWEVWDA